MECAQKKINSIMLSNPKNIKKIISYVIKISFNDCDTVIQTRKIYENQQKENNQNAMIEHKKNI